MLKVFRLLLLMLRLFRFVYVVFFRIQNKLSNAKIFNIYHRVKSYLKSYELRRS